MCIIMVGMCAPQDHFRELTMMSTTATTVAAAGSVANFDLAANESADPPIPLKFGPQALTDGSDTTRRPTVSPV